MVLFREQDRLPENPHILRITDPADFALYRQNEEYGIIGIIYDRPLSEKERTAVDAMPPPYKRFTSFEFNAKASRRKLLKPAKMHFPKALLPLIYELTQCATAAGIDKNEVLRCHFRQNSYLKSYDPHLDPLPLISYSLSGMSTVLFNSKGQPFHPHNAITLIGEKLLHSVPVKPENFNPQTQPRKTILIASDYKT